MPNGKVVFRRIRGRVIPIRQKSGEPNKKLQAGAVGASALSAVVSVLPLPGKAGFFASQVASLAIDAGGTALNAASVAKLSKKRRLKEFAKAEFRSQAIGYGLMGGVFLAQRKNRRMVAKWSEKAITKLRKFL